MKSKEQVQNGVRRFKKWFLRLSFWKKIIIIFTLNTLVLLIITDAIMLVLIEKVSNDLIVVAQTDRDQFNKIANTQIAASVAKLLLSKFDMYANNINLLINTFSYYPRHLNYYVSNEGPNSSLPRLTSQFNTPSYKEAGLYLANQNAVKYDIPYVDQLLSKLMTDSTEVKRISMYIQNKTIDKMNITINTIPGTNDFILRNPEVLDKKAALIKPFYYAISESYPDMLSQSDNTSHLISLTVGGQNSIFVVLIEVQIHIEAIHQALKNIYYFPSTYIMLVKNNGTHKVLMSQNTQPIFYEHLQDFYEIGTHEVVINGESYLGATVGMADQYKYGTTSTITNNPNDPFRCIVIVKANQAEQPSISMQAFLINELTTIQGMIFSWSVIILLTTIGLATVMGNYVFLNLKTLALKMKQYIKNPSKYHMVLIELKELEVRGILKKLIQNVIRIIEKIEERKRQKKNRISPNYHPLNIGDSKFQVRQQLNDYAIIQKIEEQVKLKQAINNYQS